jgi:hypothetical protein
MKKKFGIASNVSGAGQVPRAYLAANVKNLLS